MSQLKLLEAAAKAEKANAGLTKLLRTFGRANAIIGGISLGIDLYKGLKKFSDDYFFSIEGDIRFYDSKIKELNSKIKSSDRSLLKKRGQGPRRELTDKEIEKAEKIREDVIKEKQSYEELKKSAIEFKKDQEKLKKAEEFGIGKLVISNDGILDKLNSHTEHLVTNNDLLSNILTEFSGLKSLCSCDTPLESDILPTDNKLPVKARASGGPVNKNSLYLVGEKGPELFIPSLSGTILPNNTNTSADNIINNLRDLGSIANKIFGDLEQKAQNWANTFVDSVLLGQQTFKQFIASILDDLAKVALEQAVSPIKSFLGDAIGTVFGSLFGGGGNINGGINPANALPGFGGAPFGLASGGPITGNSLRLVGEHGPELFMPSSNGKIIPNHRLNGSSAGSNGVSVNTTVNINGGNVGPNGADPKTAMAVQKQFENMAKQAFQSQLRQEMRPGGMLTAGV